MAGGCMEELLLANINAHMPTFPAGFEEDKIPRLKLFELDGVALFGLLSRGARYGKGKVLCEDQLNKA